MMRREMQIVLVGILLNLVTMAGAGEGVLSTAGKILQISPGARAVAMGEANVANADDVYSLYWNPAGLVNVYSPQLSYMHNLWLQQIQDAYMCYAQRLFQGGVGFSVNYFNFGQMEKIGVDASGYPLPTNETFTPYSLVLTAGYGTHLLKDMDAGASVKLVSETVDTFNSMSLAVDLGLQFSLLDDLNAGLVIQNLGIPLEGYQLPLNAKVGLAYNIPFTFSDKKDRLLSVFDFTLPIPTDQPYYANLGLEYSYQGLIAARVGYKISEINKLGGASGLTAGMGINYASFILDYAIAPFGDLGITHRISFSYTFDSGKKHRKGKRAKRPGISRSTRPSSGTAGLILPPGQTPVGENVIVPKVSPMTMRKELQVVVNSVINSKEKTRVDKVSFTLQLSDERKVSKWSLKITDANDNPVQTYAGVGMPETIEWQGRDQKDKILKESIFCKYAFTVEFADGNDQTLTGPVVEEQQRGGGEEVNQETLPKIYFEENSSDLSEASLQTLKAAAGKINSRPYIKILVEGYADGGNENSMAFLLSQKRADTVSRYLTATFKIPLKNISGHARGNKNPAASNQTEPGRKQNRRVEITIIYQQ